MEEWKGRFTVYVANGALIGALVVFVLACWMLVLDFLSTYAWLLEGLRLESQVKLFTALIMAILIIVSFLASRNLRSKLRGDPLVAALILCIAFLGMRAHRYIFYWDWKRSCASGESYACWSLSKAHQKRNGFGMHPSKAAYYENQACELGLEYGCVAMIRRGETDFSQSMCEAMSWNCEAQKDSEIFVEERDLMCFAVETHCQKHLRRK